VPVRPESAPGVARVRLEGKPRITPAKVFRVKLRSWIREEVEILESYHEEWGNDPINNNTERNLNPYLTGFENMM
jgi:hypothetical protein